MTKIVTREEFDQAVEAIWGELEYQNELRRRTKDEANNIPGFTSLMNVYVRKTEEDFAMLPTNEPALHGLRKMAGIAIRGMVYCGVRRRGDAG
ncbi:hypothetical protein EV128_12553 [Rhizobium azibense]|nr:hypothetical protein EV128_12553 [Rhizobium azibense]